VTSKSLNFTGRKKIDIEKINLRLVSNGVNLTIEGTADLSSLAISDPFEVYLEVYRQTYRVRVKGQTPEAGIVRFWSQLDATETPDSLLCMVKVLKADGADKGKILALAEKIRPELGGASGGTSLLPTEAADLGQRLWRLDTSGDLPVLQVNAALSDWRGFASEPDFQKLAYPEVVRGVAAWLLDATDSEESELDSVATQWLEWFRTLGMALPQERSPESDEQWIEDSAARSAERWEILDKWIQQHETEVE
jgi:hypothetical protein